MRILRWTALVIALALMAGCSGSSSSSGSTIRVTRDGPIVPVFHPVRATDNTYPLLYLIFDPLVSIAADEKTVEPRLAESWTVSDDARTFTFVLRDDVKWQDGKPLTADDVVFTATWAARFPGAYQGQPMAWDQIQGAAEAADGASQLSGAVAVDAKTVKFTLAEPNAGFLAQMANAPNVIMPKHLLADETDKTLETSDFVTKPVGTGPFSLSSYKADQYVELAANEDYFGGAPKSDRLIWKILSGNQIATQLESGDLDIAFGLPQENRSLLKGASGLELVDNLSVGMVGLFTRTESPALKDPRVRQALYYGIDRQALIDTVLGGKAERLWNPPGLSLKDLETYDFDQDKARSLLAEAGWDKSNELRLVYWKDAPQAGQALPIIQEQLAKIDVKVTLNPLESDDWDDMVTNPERRDEWDLDYEFGGTYGLGPDYSSGQYGNCKGDKVQTGYQDCDLAALFVKARSIVDPDAQAQVQQEIAETINREADAIYLWQPYLLNGVSNSLNGVEAYPFDRHSFLKAAEWAKK